MQERLAAGLSLASNRIRGLALVEKTSFLLSPSLFFPFCLLFWIFLKLIFNKGFEISDAAKLWDNGRFRADAEWLEKGVAWEQMEGHRDIA